MLCAIGKNSVKNPLVTVLVAGLKRAILLPGLARKEAHQLVAVFQVGGTGTPVCQGARLRTVIL